MWVLILLVLLVVVLMTGGKQSQLLVPRLKSGLWTQDWSLSKGVILPLVVVQRYNEKAWRGEIMGPVEEYRAGDSSGTKVMKNCELEQTIRHNFQVQLG